MRFALGRHQRFLHVVRVLGVDVGQVGAALGRLEAARAVRERLRAGRLLVGGAGVAGAIGVAEGGVGHAHAVTGQVQRAHAVFAALVLDLAQDGVAACRVADEVERMRVVGGDDDQRVFGRGGIHGRLHRIGHGDGVAQCAGRVAAVVGVVDARAFHHQHIAFLVPGQVGDGRAGQFRQRGLAGTVLGAVLLVLHVVRFEQAEQGRRIGGSLELVGVPGIGALRMRGLPFGDQVAAIQAQADLVGVFRVLLVDGGELAATAAQRDQRAATVARGGQQLLGDIHAASGLGRFGQVGVVLPVALGRVRVGGCRGGVGQACGGDDAGGHVGAVGQLQPGEQALVEAVGAVVAAAGADADGAHVRLHAGGDGGHGAGRIGGLRVGVVGLAERRGREALPGQQVLFARVAVTLAFEDACGGHGGQAHAVAEEQDHVFGLAAHGAIGGGARCAIAVPPLRGFTFRVGDLGHVHEDRRGAGGGLGRGAGAGAEQQSGQGSGQERGFLHLW
ncbi:hypothetical protein D3C81_685890 [compost metagenome]